ncbi:hypothetical protein CYLTODRAFT_489736 [Cylindrobasidium torrendii FP15055 ss-10]|uniref:RBR-type E3 ubiquitin transferase n=1 Tax=Cylindrobasidium torrendii FP15055 ss-10 TaxID=1314674 RepID=A0A0D7BD49_9AGAR|nr:hypothetical protein CYLTODRAFT_489736 [Cylindrobasidium torrendii FP15055 ss-10]
MSDVEYSDDDYYDDEDMYDGTQDDADDDGMDMDNEDFQIDAGPKRKPYETEHESLSQAEVERLMRREIEQTRNILGTDESVAGLLLRHMSWNKERLIEQYMDNPSKLTDAAGITIPEPPSPASAAPVRSRSSRPSSKPLPHKRPSPSKKDEPFVCPICFDDAPGLETSGLDCNHQYCIGCWTAYLSSKIRDEGEHFIRCMAEGCSIVAPDCFVHASLLRDEPETWPRFKELLARHYVSCNPSLKFCPHPGCTNTVSCPGASSKSSLLSIVPTVSCGARGIPGQEKGPDSITVAREHKFCFGCPIDSDHRPVICNVAKMWMKKCADDSETANWIKSNTKECPKCNSTIEKNGGCNHMTCKKCKNEFCWVCMGPWSDHGTSWYSCNRYEEKAGIEARDAQSRSRASLERYLHYYNRWANHEQSAKLSLELYKKTEKKMEEMQITSSLTWIEVQFMKKAVEEADKCRETLKWTYAMAYYLCRGNHKELFEDNQRDLEHAVEELSELLEQPIESDTIPTLRQKVTDKTVYVSKRNEIVLDDTANGFLEGRWKWNVHVDGFDDPDPADLAF